MQTMSVRAAIVGLILVLAFTVVATTRAGPSATAVPSPSGSRASDARDVDCNWEYLEPASNIWYRLDRRAGERLHVSLVSYPETLKAMEFYVYGLRSAESGEILGSTDLIGHGQTGQDLYAQEWEGTPSDGVTYLANVINQSSNVVAYGMCDSD